MVLSYEFSIGSVRVKEKNLLSLADYEQMLNFKSKSELLRFLKDKGYGEGETLDEILDSNREKMWRYIKSTAPDFSIFDPFFLQNDNHNLKTVLKGLMYEKDYTDLIIAPYTIKPEEMKKAIENKKFSVLPEWLAPSAEEAYQLLAQTRDARLSDAVLDRAVLEKINVESKKSKSDFLTRYFNTVIFYANIKIALRAARLKPSKQFLDIALCDCERFDKDMVITKTLMGNEVLIKYLEKVDAYDCQKAIKHYTEKSEELEKFVDNKLMALAKQECKLTSEGAEPLFGYYTGCEYERKAIHMIASGIVTQTPPEQIRERLRDIYG